MSEHLPEVIETHLGKVVVFNSCSAVAVMVFEKDDQQGVFMTIDETERLIEALQQKLVLARADWDARPKTPEERRRLIERALGN